MHGIDLVSVKMVELSFAMTWMDSLKVRSWYKIYSMVAYGLTALFTEMETQMLVIMVNLLVALEINNHWTFTLSRYFDRWLLVGVSIFGCRADTSRS